MRHLGKACLTFAVACGLAISAASAQTPKTAAPAAKPARKARAERVKPVNLTEACEVDTELFCSQLRQTKGPQVTKCLRDNKASVSQGCAAALGGK